MISKINAIIKYLKYNDFGKSTTNTVSVEHRLVDDMSVIVIIVVDMEEFTSQRWSSSWLLAPSFPEECQNAKVVGGDWR